MSTKFLFLALVCTVKGIANVPYHTVPIFSKLHYQTVIILRHYRTVPLQYSTITVSNKFFLKGVMAISKPFMFHYSDKKYIFITNFACLTIKFTCVKDISHKKGL